MAEKKNTRADTINSFFLPMRSARVPHTIAPIRHPINAIVMARPCCDGLSAI